MELQRSFQAQSVTTMTVAPALHKKAGRRQTTYIPTYKTLPCAHPDIEGTAAAAVAAAAAVFGQILP